ncbi:TetR/AcrR family transcriptional regulator [Limosilactobacillus caecicola]|uniref:TetR/AcrR family transcriptional regulator n=1 Tax=Limosilactobacillus caecicola TaxID=2941332 RepID=UPI00203DCCFD|nr:TetR/AcrR family transcriptional regulator [Limosilactobacillus caecicola]
MATNKNDLRWRRTSEQLKRSFIKELSQQSFNQLTISQLIKTAGISRRAFYLHYQDKYDLLHQLETKVIADLQRAFQEDHRSFVQTLDDKQELWKQNYLLLNHVLQLIHRERSLFRVLLSANGDPNFRQSLWQLTANEIDTRVALYHAEFNDRIPVQYAKVLIVDGLIGLILAWINNPHPESVENFSKIVTNSQLIAPLDLLTPLKG